MSGPGKVLASDAGEEGARRFKFTPLHRRLQESDAHHVSLQHIPIADENIDLVTSHLGTALKELTERNLTEHFSRYASEIRNDTLSLALVLRCRAVLVKKSCDALLLAATEQPLSIEPIALCIAALARDLGVDYFAPFFPSVINTFANVFNGSNDNQLFWEPHIAVLPIFSALAGITKVLLAHLIGNPADTLIHLSPLIGHAHYRIREMTAESSIGYILKKTRENNFRDALITRVVQVTDTESVLHVENVPIVHGAGVSLFEAVKSLSGTLHCRAESILNCALRACINKNDSVFRRRVAVIAHSVARLCLHIKKNKESVKQIVVFLVAAADKGAEDRQWQLSAASLFLLRHGLPIIAGNDGNNLPESHFLRIANVVERCVTQFPENQQVSFEGMGCFLALLQNSNRHCSRQTIGILKRLIDGQFKLMTTMTHLKVLELFSSKMALELLSNPSFDLMPTLSAICDSIASHEAPLADVVSGELGNSEPTSSDAEKSKYGVLFSAVLFIRHSGSNCTPFCSPVLNRQVQLAFAELVNLFVDGKVRILESANCFPPVTQAVLDYIQFSHVPSVIPHIARLTSCEVKLGFLGPIACAAVRYELPDECNAVVFSLMKLLAVESVPESVLVALNLFCKKTGSQFIRARLSEEEINGIALNLCTKLSSASSLLRKQCAILILNLISDVPNRKDTESDDMQIFDHFEHHCAMKVRMKLASHVAGECPDPLVIASILTVLLAPYQLDCVPIVREIFDKLAVLARKSSSFSNLGRSALNHAVVGMFSVRFKPFWEPSRALWGALVEINGDEARKPMISALLNTSKQVLEYYSVQRDSKECIEDSTDYADDAEDENYVPHAKDRVVKVSKSKSGRRKRPRPKHLSDVGAGQDKEITSTSHSWMKSKKYKSNSMFTLLWSVNEWETQPGDATRFKYPSNNWKENFVYDGELENTSVDALTMHIEYLKVLIQFPKSTLEIRATIVDDLYLALDPVHMSRQAGNQIVKHYGVLMEKMGGLKISENNKNREKMLRNRLLRDLCRPNSSSQAEIMRCLCASRSPELKPYKEILLRIIADKTFREEVALITESLSGANVEGHLNTSKKPPRIVMSDPMVDVLVRICFSKMKGNYQKFGARRSAAVSFVASCLSSTSAVPMLVELVLQNFMPIIDDIAPEQNLASGAISLDLSSREIQLPVGHIYRGTLTSLEAILKHARSSISSVTWRRIAIAIYLILRKSVMTTKNQDIRSDGLNLIALMLRKNSNLTYFVCSPALELMKSIGAAGSGSSSLNNTPALLKFLAACMESDNEEFVTDLIRTHFWVCEWALKILCSESATNAVELVADVALGIISIDCTTCSIDIKTEVHESREKLLDTLASSIRIRLCNLLESGDENWHRSKINRDTLQSIMKVLSKLCSCSELNVDVTTSLADSLLTIICESKLSGDPLLSSIQAFELLISRLCAVPHDSVEAKFVPRLIPLFSSPLHSAQPDVKDALCKVLRRFGNIGLRMVSYLMNDMVAMNSSRIGEADLDTQIQAFNTLIDILKRALDVKSGDYDVTPSIVIHFEDVKSSKSFSGEDPDKGQQSGVWCTNTFLLVLYGAVSAIEDEDISIRGVASYTLQLLVRWIQLKGTDLNNIVPIVTELISTKCLSSTTVEARRELCKSLGNLVRDSDIDSLSSSAELIHGLHCLADEEQIEADFFENIAHIQIHRRGRALRRMAKKLDSVISRKETYNLVSNAVRQFIFPLSMRIALEVRDNRSDDGKWRGSIKSKEAMQAYNRDVTKSAVELNRCAASYLPWKEYRKELTWVIRRISKETDEIRVEILYSLLVALADAFPGSKSDVDDGIVESTRKMFIQSYLLPKLISFISTGSVEGEVRISTNSSKRDKFGGEDRSQKCNIFRAPIGIAAAKLMSQLDKDELAQAIPSLITPLSNALRSRMNEIRIQSKKVLVQVVLLLDPKYFSYVVNQVLSALVHGFRKDSIIHVIHALLSGIQDFRGEPNNDEMKSFPVDDAVEKLCEAMASELEDGVHVSKTNYLNPNASDTRLKESSNRASKVSDAAQLLASLVHFPTSAENLLKPFTKLLVSTTSSKLCSRVENVLQKIMVGFSKNASVTADEGLKLAYNLVHSNMPSPSLLVDDGTEDKTVLRDQLLELMSGRQFSNSPGSHILAELGWQLLYSLLSTSVVHVEGSSAESLKNRSVVEPFVPELLLSMRARYDSLTRISLKCAQKVLRLPISNRRNVADFMIATTIEILCGNLGVSVNRGAPIDKGTIVSDDGLFTTCLRVAAVLIHEIGHHETTGIKKERIVALLQISKNVVDHCSVESRSAALSLIRSTISAKIAIPEVYDTVEHVSKLAIEVQSSSLKSSCTNIVVQFLVRFPLSKKRVRQHLEFVVRNLSYELAHGRIAAINILVALCQQLPDQSLKEEAEYFVLSLMAMVARDADRDCRKTAALALKTIFSSVTDGRVFDSMLKMAVGMLAVPDKNSNSSQVRSGDPDLLRSGAIAISSAAQSGKLSTEQLKTCASQVTRALLYFNQMSWDTVHAFLSCLEHIIECQPKNGQMKDQIELQMELKSFWAAIISQFLLHKHEWVRLGASRLLGKHISTAGGREANNKNEIESLYCVLWTRDGTLRSIVKTHCLQFEAMQISEELAKQALKNILCISNLIWKYPEAGNIDSMTEHCGEERKDKNRPLTWIISRMSGMCTRVGSMESAFLRRACALRFLMQAVKWWGADAVNCRLHSFVAPVVQILESADVSNSGGVPEANDCENGKDESCAGLQTLALSLKEIVSELVGVNEYYKVYNTFVSKRRTAKIEKKRERALEAAIDPEKAAKRKLRKAEKKITRRKAAKRKLHGDRVLHATYQVFEKGERPSLRDDA